MDGQETESVTHEIDHVRDDAQGALALEIEWNNKDPFFDRDLENFKRLHAEGAISVGIIVTRGASLQTALREIILDCAT
ncbi:BglII/BstYI family type II restriction endonuclease [Candidatus Rariloculus sp.]|uniref:BglII/BstYI family type II restriction endonuclease n=1 Tax=Candidatus Rariloculus sp. TaxID=3101265 RepID=UPI003D0F7DB6